MPKKFTILSALAALSISTAGAIVPTFADTTEIYRVPDVVSLRTPFANDMVSECGTFANTNAYWDCYDAVMARYRSEYGGQFESMYQLNSSGRMLVTGLNPTVGSLRFYLDETNGFQDTAFTFENVVIFWVDDDAINNPAWNEPIGWEFVDSYLETGEIPRGYHVLYSSKRGEDGWATPNAENRVLYDLSTNTPEDVAKTNSYGFIHAYGYDTMGNRHLENNYLGSCLNNILVGGNECRLEYTYNGSYISQNYVKGEATGEDVLIVELKNALKAKAEAEAALADALARAETAEADYANAMDSYWELESVIIEYQTTIAETEARLVSAEAALREAEVAAAVAREAAVAAENRASEAESRANSAENRASEAESRADVAETRARLVEESANAEIAAARETVERARFSIEEARISEQTAIEAKEQAENLAKQALKEAEEAKSPLRKPEKTLTKPLPALTKLSLAPKLWLPILLQLQFTKP